MKELAAQEIAKRVKDGQFIGVGTGSTVELALKAIAARLASEKMSIKVMATSLQSEWQCQQMGLEVVYNGYQGELDWGFDGADEVDEKLRLIKGRGGAMLREKLIAARCKKFIVIVDESKIVKRLGEKKPVPVEVIPQALWLAEKGLRSLGATSVAVRQCAGGKDGPVVTELGNLVVDATFSAISDSLEADIKKITGVVDSGLFTFHAHEVIVASAAGIKVLTR